MNSRVNTVLLIAMNVMLVIVIVLLCLMYIRPQQNKLRMLEIISSNLDTRVEIQNDSLQGAIERLASVEAKTEELKKRPMPENKTVVQRVEEVRNVTQQVDTKPIYERIDGIEQMLKTKHDEDIAKLTARIDEMVTNITNTKPIEPVVINGVDGLTPELWYNPKTKSVVWRYVGEDVWQTLVKSCQITGVCK